MLAISLTGAARAQSLFFSTHDWPTSSPTDDTWADVKTPGDGRSYLVGTTTYTGAFQFSNGVVTPPPVPLSTTTQVAILQINEGDLIYRQAFFCGETTLSPGLSTFARAIAVAPGASPTDTRIAICGETFDSELPYPAGVANPSPGNSWTGGFIAVYDGNATLLWTHHLFGDTGVGHTIVTDVSIRHDASTGDDIVTYCGASSTPRSSQTNMTPIRPFAGFTNPACGETFAGGDYDNGLSPGNGFWHGYVGRVRAPHGGPVGQAPTVDFHSIVGGDDEEGLFGLVELDEDRFAVAGAIRVQGTAQTLFPLTRRDYFGQNVCWPTTAATYGVAMLFDAQGIASGQNLVLQSSAVIGTTGTGNITIARDIAYQGGRLIVVGSTTDSLMADSATTWHGFQNTYPSGSLQQGFIVQSSSLDAGFERASYFNDAYASSIVGVAGWSEYPDHITVAGWTQSTPTSPSKIEVASLFFDTPNTPADAVTALLRLRGYVISAAGVGTETPGTTDDPFISAFASSSSAVLTIERPAGGAVAVDQRGRVHVVGYNRFSNDYELQSGPVVAARSRQGSPVSTAHADAVHTILDMLPGGVCRSDGTGKCSPAWSATSGDGGTTPTCALVANGGTLLRVMIDCEGDPGSGQPFNVLLDRPHDSMVSGAGFLQIGFPATAPLFPLGAGLEVWTTGGGLAPQPTFIPIGTSHREPLWSTLPPGPLQFTVQFLGAFAQPVCAGSTTTFTASPALIVSY